LGLETEQVVVLNLGERALRAPIVVLPGHADNAVTLSLGYGHQGTRSLARDVGINAYLLRTGDALQLGSGVSLEKTSDTYELAFTQDHWSLHDRDIAMHTSLEAYRENPDFTAHLRGPQPSLLPQVFDYDEPEQWAMTIDTT